MKLLINYITFVLSSAALTAFCADSQWVDRALKETPGWLYHSNKMVITPDGTNEMITAKSQMQRKTAKEPVTIHTKMVYDPKTGLLWLGYDSFQNFYAWPDQVVGIGIMNGADFFVRISAEKAKTEGELREALQKFATEASDRDLEGRRIYLRGIVGRWVFGDRDHAEPPPKPIIKDARMHDSNLILTLEGQNQNKQTAVITFDKQMQPISATVEGKLVYDADQGLAPK